ncbi:hypothetical protein BASA81_005375 [Batrachochytrium salamandrivorans]|nr:hypothetical protein BASA81_005375 [Batrachochytrium salamandrivorans]
MLLCFPILLLGLLVPGWGLEVIPTAFRYPNFLNHPKLSFVGDARTEVAEIVLSGPKRSQTGGVWFNQQLQIKSGFFTEFTTSGSLQRDNSGKFGFAFVIHTETEQSLGLGDKGFGYTGMGEGLAVEFSPDGIDIQDALFPSSKLLSSKDKTMAVNNLLAESLLIRIELSERILTVTAHAAKSGKLALTHSHQLPHALVSVDGYFIGFTSATGKRSAARFAIKSWKFGSHEQTSCLPGFTGPDCGMTNDQASVECPRRNTCLGCVNEAYNCMWCGGECMAGNKECQGGKYLVLEELGCSSGLNYMWLWIALGLCTLVLCFGSILVRVLSRKEANRAVGLLVSLTLGALGGMTVSVLVAASLVEISSTPFFSLAYGSFFFYLAYLVFNEVWTPTLWEHRARWENLASMVLVTCVALAGVLCFVVDKEIVLHMPEALKVLCFMILACALTFCIVFASVDVYHELLARCFPQKPTGMETAEDARRKVLSISHNKAVYALLIFASLVSGLYFGLVFGLMRIEQEQVYRASLLLKREAIYTFPFGAVVGGLSGLLIRFVTMLPSPNADYDVERIIDEAKDDL